MLIGGGNKSHYYEPHFDFLGLKWGLMALLNPNYIYDSWLREILKHEIQFIAIRTHYFKPHFDFFGVKWGLVGLIHPLIMTKKLKTSIYQCNMNDF